MRKGIRVALEGDAGCRGGTRRTPVFGEKAYKALPKRSSQPYPDIRTPSPSTFATCIKRDGPTRLLETEVLDTQTTGFCLFSMQASTRLADSVCLRRRSCLS